MMGLSLSIHEGKEYDPIKAAADVADLMEHHRKRLDRAIELYDLEQEGRLVVLPCNDNAELVRDGETYKADHWNHTLTAFREEPTTRSGKRVALFSIEEAEDALRGEDNG